MHSQALIDGKNARVAMHLAEGKLDRLPELAKALVILAAARGDRPVTSR
jgi:hypothetical protein